MSLLSTERVPLKHQIFTIHIIAVTLYFLQGPVSHIEWALCLPVRSTKSPAASYIFLKAFHIHYFVILHSSYAVGPDLFLKDIFAPSCLSSLLGSS